VGSSPANSSFLKFFVFKIFNRKFMVYQFILVRKSLTSFKVFATFRGKIRSKLFSGELRRFKLGRETSSDIFIQNFDGKPYRRYFRDARIKGGFLDDYYKFIEHARCRTLQIFYCK
jgi:hypothetical protein